MHSMQIRARGKSTMLGMARQVLFVQQQNGNSTPLPLLKGLHASGSSLMRQGPIEMSLMQETFQHLLASSTH